MPSMPMFLASKSITPSSDDNESHSYLHPSMHCQTPLLRILEGSEINLLHSFEAHRFKHRLYSGWIGSPPIRTIFIQLLAGVESHRRPFACQQIHLCIHNYLRLSYAG